MIRIAITVAAYEAIAATLPLGSVGYETAHSEKGEVFIWLEERWLDKLKAMRGPGESYSDVIVKLAAQPVQGPLPTLTTPKLITAHAERLVTPSLVAIYTWRKGCPPHQSGTGFLINCRGRPAMVTARHVLYGHNFDEQPLAKHVWFNGDLRPLGELGSGEILQDADNDLAAMYADERGLLNCFPMSCLSPTEAACAMITINGLLARDFRRDLSARLIKPNPWRMTNERAPWKSGYTAMRYQRSKWTNARTGKPVQAPRPVGMSGAPMLDSLMLGAGKVMIVGVFTDYVQEKGLGFGEAAPKVIALLAGLHSAQ
jgi:hypothetical protein